MRIAASGAGQIRGDSHGDGKVQALGALRWRGRVDEAAIAVIAKKVVGVYKAVRGNRRLTKVIATPTARG